MLLRLPRSLRLTLITGLGSGPAYAIHAQLCDRRRSPCPGRVLIDPHLSEPPAQGGPLWTR